MRWFTVNPLVHKSAAIRWLARGLAFVLFGATLIGIALYVQSLFTTQPVLVSLAIATGLLIVEAILIVVFLTVSRM
jgi:hypothetical protein